MRNFCDWLARLIKRNLRSAEAIGLQGTPGFLVGAFKANQALNEQGFVRMVADGRAHQKTK